MPLTWDVNDALSREATLLYSLADRLSETEGFRRLNNDSTAEEARTKVKIGPQNDPWEAAVDGKATVEQLQEILLRANIHPSPDNPHEATEADAVSTCPNEGGTFQIWIRRQFTDEELEENTEDQLYLAFLDCTSSIVHELVELSSAYDRVVTCRVVEPALFGSLDKRSAQGVFMFSTLELDWGDRGAGGGEA